MTANEIANWVGDACSDIAIGQVQMWEDCGFDDTYGKRLEALKADGVEYIAEAYAEELYDDPHTLRDFMGDRVCDEIGWGEGTKEPYNAMVEELRQCRKHSTAWNKACDMMLRED